MKELFFSKNYLFIFAHPDDEIYCSVLLKQLIDQGKSVNVIYLTSGDSGGNPDVREQELYAVYKLIGLTREHIHLLRTPETKIFLKLSPIISAGIKITQQHDVDCVIGQDYEGGHEGHDIASFCAQEIVHRLHIRGYYIFPVYHGKPTERKGARFKPSRKRYIEINLNHKESMLKKHILTAYQSQQKHFDGLQQSSADYKRLLFSREQFFKVSTSIDFSKKPMQTIGYEYHRNGFSFKKFQDILKKYNQYVKKQ